jgi:tRNA A-37 threonylcarbamoyl transferase component Bud32
MSNARFERLQQLFEEALQQPLAQRPGWVRAVADDAALAAEVLALLECDGEIAARQTRRPLAMALAGLGAEGESAVGRRVGRYELVQEIGSGGMGRVYRARRVDAEVEQWVALKLMRRERVQESLVQRFSHERRILAHLKHSGIAHFIDAGTDDDGTPFVVMELVEGLPLLEHCAAHDLDLRARLSLFRQVLAAVSHAHHALVIHRDIKPGNVLVTADGEAKLLDFGIAKPLSFETGDTRTHDRVFTPGSAAPEQLRGGLVDVTTDVYGLGALLYELLSGSPAIDASGVSVGELERRILLHPPAPMNVARAARTEGPRRGLATPIPQDLEHIVQKALRKEPAARYPSVEQFDADIERFLQRRPVLASRAGTAYRARKFLQRNAWPVAFAALALSGVLAGTVLVALQNRAIRLERDRAQGALAIMKNAFVAADPSRLAGGDVTARQILESSGEAIAPLATTQPEDYIELAANIADVELSLGLVEPAAALLDEASRLAPPQSLRDATRQSLQVLAARAHLERNEVSAAERIVDAHLSGEGDQAATYWYLKGVMARKRSQPAVAVEALSKSIDATKPASPDGQWFEAHLLLADSLNDAKRGPEALALLDRLIETLNRERGPDHAQVLRAQLARLDALRAAGQAERMRNEGQGLVAQIARRYGRNSALTGSAEEALAGAFIADADYAQAAEHKRLATESFEHSLGPTHPKSFRTRFDLGSLLWRVPGRSMDAEPEFEAALRNGAAYLPATDPVLAFFRLEFANYLVWGRKPERALQVYAGDVERLTQAKTADPNREEIARMLAAAYTQADCGVIPDGLAEAEISAAICRARPADVPHCQSARSAACLLFPAAAGADGGGTSPEL